MNTRLQKQLKAVEEKLGFAQDMRDYYTSRAMFYRVTNPKQSAQYERQSVRYAAALDRYEEKRAALMERGAICMDTTGRFAHEYGEASIRNERAKK